MKIGDVIHILNEFNKWRRGLPPYEWSEDPSKQKELPYSAGEIGVAIDEAVAMLRHAADMMELEEKREKKFEYAARYFDGYTPSFHYRSMEDLRDGEMPFAGDKFTVIRREVGEWQDVKE